jgi:hypothetical protein
MASHTATELRGAARVLAQSLPRVTREAAPQEKRPRVFDGLAEAA